WRQHRRNFKRYCATVPSEMHPPGCGGHRTPPQPPAGRLVGLPGPADTNFERSFGATHIGWGLKAVQDGGRGRLRGRAGDGRDGPGEGQYEWRGPGLAGRQLVLRLGAAWDGTGTRRWPLPGCGQRRRVPDCIAEEAWSAPFLPPRRTYDRPRRGNVGP